MSIIGRLGYSVIVTLIGLFIVFLGLIILIGCIKLMSKVVSGMTAKKAAKTAPAPTPAPAPVVVPAPVAEAAAEETGLPEEELVAVITAAIMACAKPGAGKKLVVKGIRRGSAWAAAGRAEQLSRF